MIDCKQYIYVLKHPISDEIVYVGKTKNVKRRSSDHFRLPKGADKYKTNLGRWRFELISGGLKPILEVIHECTKDDVDKYEKEFIYKYKSLGLNLLNMTDGGDGLQYPSDEVRRKIGLKSKGRKVSKETREKMSKSLYNSGNSVLCYDICGEFVGEFINSRRAAEKLNTSYKNISATLNNHRHFINGYTFFNIDEDNIDALLRYRMERSFNKSVFLCISMYGKCIECDNISKVANDIGVNFRNIWLCLNNSRKTCGGYAWVYKDDYDGDYKKYFKHGGSRRVKHIDGNGVECIYDSLKECSESLGIHKSTLCKYLKCKRIPKTNDRYVYF